MTKVDDLRIDLQAVDSGFHASMSAAQGRIRSFEKDAVQSMHGFEGAIRQARSMLIALGGTYAAFKVGKGIVDAGVQMQAMRNRMVAATGDARVAADSLAWVASEAERLGLDVREASNGFAGFSASALRAGLTLQQTKDIFRGVSEAAVSLHLPTEKVALVFKALEQMAGKGTVSMEELKQQLGDSLPGAFEIAAKAMGKTTAEFAKMVANGEVMAADFLPKFGDAIRKELGGSVEEASRGAQAAFNRMGNAFFNLQTQLAESGFLDAITESVKSMTEALNDPATIDGLKGLASMMGDIITVAAKAAAAVGHFYTEAARQRDGYLAQAQKASDNGEWFVGIGEMNKRVAQDNFTQRMIAEYVAKKKAEADQASGAQAGGVSGAYTLGTISQGSSSGPSKEAMAAQKKAEQLRQQLAGQAESLRYQFATPEQQAGMDVEKQLETLKAALDAKAITEQEYRDLSLQAEIEYQEELAHIRQEALEKDQSGLEYFLGIRMKSMEELNRATLQDQAQSFRQSISQAAQHNKAFFMLEKAAALARATIAAYESVVHAYNFGSRIGGPPLGFAMAGIAAAAQAVNIASIASASYGSSGGVSAAGGSTVAGTTGNAVLDSSSDGGASKSVYITLNGDEGTLYSKNNVRKLLEAINDTTGDGSRLIVSVSS